MSCLRLSATTLKVAADVCQPSLVTGVLPSIRIGLFENVRSCGVLLLLTHIAYGILLCIRNSKDLFKILHAAQELTIGVVEIFQFLMCRLRGSLIHAILTIGVKSSRNLRDEFFLYCAEDFFSLDLGLWRCFVFCILWEK